MFSWVCQADFSRSLPFEKGCPESRVRQVTTYMNGNSLYKQKFSRGTWGAQLVKHLTLDFGSGQNFRVRGIEPCVGLCTDSVEPAWDSLPLSPPPLCAQVCSQNK